MPAAVGGATGVSSAASAATAAAASQHQRRPGAGAGSCYRARSRAAASRGGLAASLPASAGRRGFLSVAAAAEAGRNGGSGEQPGGGAGALPRQEGVAAERQELFNTIAKDGVYDELNDLLSLGQHRVWKLATVMWSGAAAGDNVLDVCCGSGDIALLLARTVGPQGAVVGLDFAESQLEVAAAREAAQPPGGRCRVTWMPGDALALPFSDAHFAAATCGYGLRNVADQPAALAELRRVLRPGARAAVLDFNNSEWAPIRALQAFALDNVVVPAARARGVAAEYEYLRPSIERFPTGRRQVEMARQAGFSEAVHYELAGGLMGVLVATA